MQKVNIVCVGKIKEAFYRDAVAEYAKRLSRFVTFTVREIAEGRSLDEEGESILHAAKGFIIALCIEGKKMSSEGLAAEMKKLSDRGSEVTFIIGSSCGLCDKVKAAAHLKLSFSDMTFPHQLMRVILCEQIYRAYMINSGSEYHK
ncbi:MAG TPA: 23S rRNA (pseudouridine(1915)-N(3))-methyltransferase RlmH [Candidatus Coproplasma excrementigallinarum]|uniref:Ribosomal RNA large subunit methyltransferase H n=1 Tax=Candidatus Coproplasma excrementigallinarum TaxID=2840747 RepID=A0A9D1MIS8_9FIRM|nr:23S rRNA (pseudouridine(1915)-N(3))-methyltransferase RlmH [Candidatus Coproplasma excrementigallinarum]